MLWSVVIATHNRAAHLADTLASLSKLQVSGPWELVVVDNNSTDGTADVIRAAAASYPAPLRGLFEREPGRSAALNTGIRAASGDLIATTDDDVHVAPDWLDRAREALERHQADYVGGRVLPRWEAPPPAWLSREGGPHWAVIALLDYGDAAVPFGQRVPIGVNMAFRRTAFTRAGLWDTGVGRKAGTLLGQEVREWCARAREAGLRGYYAPEMVVHHLVPAARLDKRYFRRWFYWRGVSRALLYASRGLDLESPQDTRLDFSRVPRVAGVPRYLYRSAARSAARWAGALVRGHRVQAFEHELWLWFFAGVVRQRWRDRRVLPPPLGARTADAA